MRVCHRVPFFNSCRRATSRARKTTSNGPPMALAAWRVGEGRIQAAGKHKLGWKEGKGGAGARGAAGARFSFPFFSKRSSFRGFCGLKQLPIHMRNFRAYWF